MTFKVSGDCSVAGKTKGDTVTDEELVEAGATDIPALVWGGHLTPTKAVKADTQEQ